MAARLCTACGGPLSTAVEGCVDRPGAVTAADEYDAIVYADLAHLTGVEPPARCDGCGAAVDEPHHVGCVQAACGLHSEPRHRCGCDVRWLAARARTERLGWLRRLVLLRRRRSAPGEIIRTVNEPPEVY